MIKKNSLNVIIYSMALIILVLQMYVTSSKAQNYPLNPYRMFSKNWQSGILMSQVRFKNENTHEYNTWDLMRIPFFQANRLSFNVFYKSKNKILIDKLCDFLLVRSKNKSITVVGRVHEFKLNHNMKMAKRMTHHEETYTCLN